MQYEFFSVPAEEGGTATQTLNGFLRSKEIVSVDKCFRDGTVPKWYFVVEYLEGANASVEGSRRSRRIDYKEILSEEDFSVFSQLRDARKALAQAEAVPVYTVCTNEQLAAMVQEKCASVESLRAIEGLGEAKIRKYAEPLLVVLRKAFSS